MRSLLAFLGSLLVASAVPADEAIRTDSLGDPLPPLATHRLGTTRWGQTWTAGTLTWSADGKVLAAGRTDDGVGLWDVGEGKKLKHWKSAQHFSLLRATILSANGKILAAVGSDQDRTLQVFEVDTAQERKTWMSPERVYGLALSADGSRLATVGWKEDVRLWNTAQGTEIKLFPQGGRSAVFARDGKTLLIGSDKRVRAWDLETGKETQRLEGAALHLAISADDKILVGAGDNRLRVWELATGRERLAIDIKTGHDNFLAISGDGRTIAFGTEFELRAWDTGSGQERFHRRGAFRGGSAALSADGQTLAWTSGGKVERYDLAAGHDLVPSPGHLSIVYSLAFSPDGQRLLSRGADDVVLVWKLGEQPRPELSLRGGRESYIIGWQARWSPDGKLLATPAWRDQVRLLDATTGKEVRTLTSGGICGPLAFSPDGKVLATCDDHYTGMTEPRGRIHLWQTSTGQQLRTIEGLAAYIRSLVFAPDGQAIASSSGDGVHLWDVAEGKRIRRITVEHRFPNALRFSPDGQTLFAGGTGLSVCSVATGERLRHLAGKQLVTAMDLSPDGKLLALACGDTIQLWDPTAGVEVTRLTGHANVATLVFSPDGRMLASGNHDTTILLWDVIGALIAARIQVKPAVPQANLDALWADLAGADPLAGHKAIWTLADDPRRTVPFFQERLRAAKDDEGEGIVVPAGDLLRVIRAVEVLERIGTAEARTLLEKLAGGPMSRSAREAAGAVQRLEALKRSAHGSAKEPDRSDRLEQLWNHLGEADAAAGHQAAWALARSPEQTLALFKTRLKAVAQAEETDTILVPAGDALRAFRAVAVLERIGTAEARRILETLAQGASSRVTAEAKAALERLERRTKGKP